MSLKSILDTIKYETDPVKDIWYLISAVTISAVNRPEDIKHVYSVISERIDKSNNGNNDQLKAKVVLRLREAILKSYIITGFPKTINGLNHLSRATPDSVKAFLPAEPLRKEEDWSTVVAQRKRGRELFGKIYERHTQRVIDSMAESHPDLAQTALYHLYGPTLGETSVLDARETSLLTVAALMITNIPLQLVGHSHGALHNGATKDDLVRIQSIVSILADYYNLPLAKLSKL